jgi:hypothetical protein
VDDLRDWPNRLGRSKLFWVDIDDRTEESADHIAEAFDLDQGTRDRLASSDGPAAFVDHGRYIRYDLVCQATRAARRILSGGWPVHTWSESKGGVSCITELAGLSR